MISLPLLKVAIKVVVPIPNASAGIVQSTVPPIGISTVQLLLPLVRLIAAGLLPSLTAMVIIPLLILLVNVIFVIMGNKPPRYFYIISTPLHRYPYWRLERRRCSRRYFAS